jgi:L-alanine-DL-glutamate epimerase-like enolase superfamily enzyme
VSAVAGVETWVIRMPYAPGARETPDEGVEIIGAEVVAEGGARGLGFTYSLCGGGRAVAGLIEECLAPRLVGRGLEERSVIADEARWALRRLGGGPATLALAAVDIAMWDCWARILELPMHRLIGMRRERVPLFASGRYSPALPVATLVDNARRDVARGFGAIKVRIGGRPAEEDIARVTAVRRAVGNRVRLLVDAAELLDAPAARRMAGPLEELDVCLLEEPMPSEWLPEYAALAAATPIPLAAGEHHTDESQVLAALRAGAVSVVNLDVAIIGGVTPFVRAGDLVASFGATVAPHLVTDLHVGLAATLPALLYVEEFPFTEGLWREPVAIEGGEGIPPERPGHGLELRDDVLDRLRIA